MGAAELFLAAIGLSMDAFAISICKGLGIGKKSFDKTAALLISCFFGGFQALMPFVGWQLGKGFQEYIVNIDHWIAFVILLYIGLKMIYDSAADKSREVSVGFNYDYKELLILAVATSIDALAFGITLAFLGCSIMKACLFIGSVTFVFSYLGVWIGKKFKGKFDKYSGILGGILLIIIGIKILTQHIKI